MEKNLSNRGERMDALSNVIDKMGVVIESVHDAKDVRTEYFDGMFYLLSELQRDLRDILESMEKEAQHGKD